MKDITAIWKANKKGKLPPQNKRQAATIALWQAWLEEGEGYEAMVIRIPDELTALYHAASRPSKNVGAE